MGKVDISDDLKRGAVAATGDEDNLADIVDASIACRIASGAADLPFSRPSHARSAT